MDPYSYREHRMFSSLANVVVAPFQRPIDTDHLNTIIEKYRAVYKERGYFPVLGDIILCKYSGIEYLIDGQHRYFALKTLCEEMNLSIYVWTQTVPVANPLEIKMNFEMANSNVQCPESLIANLYDDARLMVMKQLPAKMMPYFKQFHSNSDTPRFPNINIKKFSDRINGIEWFFDSASSIVTVDGVLNRIMKLNSMLEDYVKDYDIELYMKGFKNKDTIDSPCFLGLYDLWHKVIPGMDNSSGGGGGAGGPIRRKFTKAERKKIWNEHVGPFETTFSGPCYTKCGSVIYRDDFHMAHCVALKKGGSNELSNIRPVCKDCNLSMGTGDLHEFSNKLSA